jgi:hypothetical protein
MINMTNTILFFTLIILLGSCNRNSTDDAQLSLPLITQTGENTFGCYVDGGLFLPRDGTGEGLEANDTLNIRCRVYDKDERVYKHYCSIEDSGSLIFSRLDGNFIAGTFEFITVNQDDPTDIISSTQGRFDIDRSTQQFKQYP